MKLVLLMLSGFFFDRVGLILLLVVFLIEVERFFDLEFL